MGNQWAYHNNVYIEIKYLNSFSLETGENANLEVQKSI